MRLYDILISIVSDRDARFTVVEGIPLGDGYRVEVWYCIPSSDRWTIRKGHPDTRRLAQIMYSRLTRQLGRPLTLRKVCLQ